MKKYILILLTLFVGSFCFSQQQKSTNNKLLPISIYTATFTPIQNSNIFNFSTITNSLNFSKNYKFAPVSFNKLESARFLISDDNLGTNATLLIYDDYKSYRDDLLLKGFLEKHDPTKWDPCNFRHSKIN